jgi:O-antigen/teichoic acid export membrane protein
VEDEPSPYSPEKLEVCILSRGLNGCLVLCSPQPMQEKYSSHSLAAIIGRNTIFGVAANVVQVLTRLVTVPIVIHHLGLGGYGIWNVIMTTATYMRFGSVGVKAAFQKYVAEATGDGDYRRASQLLSTGSAIMLAFSIAGLIPVFLYSQAIARMAGVPAGFLKSAAESIALLAVIMLLANVGAAFEAIVLGGQRIDLLRKFGTFFSVMEAGAIITVLHFGYGLAAMAALMGASELLYLTCCYFASHRIVPQVRVSIRCLSKGVLRELFRFAGSYQLVNLLDVVYNSLIPVAILRSFGADSAGVYAVVTRVVTSATSVQDSFLVPILSGGTMVFASGSAEKMQALLSKAFKATLGLSLFPLGFIAVFGPTVAYAWTGQADPRFRSAFWLVCLRALFAAFSVLAFVLYRVAGKALMDNLRQVLRISLIVVVVSLAPKVGFVGVLVGLAICEFAGMLFMLYALAKTFAVFRPSTVLPGAVRLGVAAALIFLVGLVASYIPLPGYQTNRLFAVWKLMEAGLACMIVAWPLLVGTGSVTAAEKRALFTSFFPKLSRSRG